MKYVRIDERTQPRTQAAKVVILGAGLAGFHVADSLRKSLKSSDTQAQITLIDARPHLEYQPFLAEVISGGVSADTTQVPIEPNLPGINFMQAKIQSISTKNNTVKVKEVRSESDACAASGLVREVAYDHLVIALGNTTRYLPIPGLEQHAIGLKTVDDARAIRGRLIANICEAAELPAGSAERARLLTFVVIGAGFSGVEAFSEAFWTARKLARQNDIDATELNFHLIDAADQIIGDLPADRALKVIDDLQALGAHVHLNTFCEDATDAVVKTSDRHTLPAGCIVWTAGLKPAPVLKNSDLPLTPDGRVRALADLRVCGDEGIVYGVWAAGDCAAVPDMSGGGMADGTCAPTAQHAVRQAKMLAQNIAAKLAFGPTTDYCHQNAGMVGGFGAGEGIFISGKKRLSFGGLPAWTVHRAYHAAALPSKKSKLKALKDYIKPRNLATS